MGTVKTISLTTIAFIVFVLLMAWARRAADGRLVFAESMVTMDDCPRCDLVKSVIKDAGVTLKESKSDSVVASYFPCVTYSDGHKDVGERILQHACMIRDPFKVVKLNEKKEGKK